LSDARGRRAHLERPGRPASVVYASTALVDRAPPSGASTGPGAGAAWSSPPGTTSSSRLGLAAEDGDRLEVGVDRQA
jgi:hypothetical protein